MSEGRSEPESVEQLEGEQVAEVCSVCETCGAEEHRLSGPGEEPPASEHIEVNSIGEQAAVDHVPASIHREPEIEQREMRLARDAANPLIQLETEEETRVAVGPGRDRREHRHDGA